MQSPPPDESARKAALRAGFTLIELSIVLVIIGLIVGGVLVGRDLITAAQARAQISQIEKYQTAVRTFQGKYGELPGDMDNNAATQFGFVARGQYAGEGDGNGIIEGVSCNAASCNNGQLAHGETTMVWVDLSTAGLIEGGFSIASPTATPSVFVGSFGSYFPAAKIGGTNYVNVWSGGPFFFATSTNGVNYFSIAQPTCIGCGSTSKFDGLADIPVSQAYAIDKKMDDGLPQTGSVTAGSNFLSGAGSSWAGAAGTAATPGSSTTCYDNSANSTGTPGVNGAVQHYSLEINNGAGANCALSFQFQ